MAGVPFQIVQELLVKLMDIDNSTRCILSLLLDMCPAFSLLRIDSRIEPLSDVGIQTAGPERRLPDSHCGSVIESHTFFLY